MKRHVRTKRLMTALSSMMLGTVLVCGTLIMINKSSDNPDSYADNKGTEIQFKRDKPKTQQKVERPRPRPKRQPRRSAPPTPLLGLNSQLAGIDLGLPDFSLDDLNGMDGDILGNSAGMVMTDDTVDAPPKAVYQAPMIYPPRARARGQEGYVILSLLIGITGEIEQVKVVDSQPAGVFDDVALQGINAWQFEPAQYDGRSVKSWAKQRIRFDLS